MQHDLQQMDIHLFPYESHPDSRLRLQIEGPLQELLDVGQRIRIDELEWYGKRWLYVLPDVAVILELHRAQRGLGIGKNLKRGL